MLILPDYSFPYIIESASSVVIPKHSWQFDGPALDFMLKKILTLEETIGPAAKVRINGAELIVPTSWNIMIVDDDSLYVDTMPIVDAAMKGFSAFMMSPLNSIMHKAPIEIMDFLPNEVCAHPSIYKSCMMLHPVGPVNDQNIIYSCLLGPQDLNKFIGNASPKELLF